MALSQKRPAKPKSTSLPVSNQTNVSTAKVIPNTIDTRKTISGISTKQRLAQGAMAAVPPKAVPVTELNPLRKSSKPLPTRTNNPTLMNLSFKKNPPPISIPSSSNQPDSAPTSALRSPSFSGTPMVQAQSPGFDQTSFSPRAGTPPEAQSLFNMDVMTMSPVNMSPQIPASLESPSRSASSTFIGTLSTVGTMSTITRSGSVPSAMSVSSLSCNP